jgi:hypothetical protein
MVAVAYIDPQRRTSQGKSYKHTLSSGRRRISIICYPKHSGIFRTRLHYSCRKISFISISSGECDSDEIKSGDEAALRKCASEGNEYAAFQVTVDGEKLNIQPIQENRTDSRFFNITIPKDNLYDVNPGTFKAVVDGYFALLKPLSPGEHKVRVVASVSNPLDPSFNFAYDANYIMKVQ